MPLTPASGVRIIGVYGGKNRFSPTHNARVITASGNAAATPCKRSRALMSSLRQPAQIQLLLARKWRGYPMGVKAYALLYDQYELM
jgi:hypothetical protein